MFSKDHDIDVVHNVEIAAGRASCAIPAHNFTSLLPAGSSLLSVGLARLSQTFQTSFYTLILAVIRGG